MYCSAVMLNYCIGREIICHLSEGSSGDVVLSLYVIVSEVCFPNGISLCY